jgi:hypothetical protein
VRNKYEKFLLLQFCIRVKCVKARLATGMKDVIFFVRKYRTVWNIVSFFGVNIILGHERLHD